MKIGSLGCCLLSSAAFLALSPSAVAQNQAVHIRAYVDGFSEIVLSGSDVQWRHYLWAAPGRVDCDSGRPIDPTYVDANVWYPTWPDVPDCENRDCGGCTSDVAALIAPPLPSSEFLPTLVVQSARGGLTVVETPTAANGFRTVIAFDDNVFGGADWYEFDVLVEPCYAENVCTSTVNSTGNRATMSVTGDLAIGSNKTYLHAFDCPPDRLGVFLVGTRPANIPLANGRLCIDPFAGIQRIQAMRVDPFGTATIQPDLLNSPYLPDTDFYFQYWFRDPLGGGTGSNLTDAVHVRFCQ